MPAKPSSIVATRSATKSSSSSSSTTAAMNRLRSIALFREEHRIIVLLTVCKILDEAIARKLA
jgi:hypothetical protein